MVPFLAQIKAPAVKLPKASTLAKNAKVKAAEADAESWISAHGLTVAAIILAVILIGVLVYMIRQRRKKTPEELTTEVIEPQSLGLVRVWKEFIRNLPRRYRTSINLFQSYVVFGSDGSGKTTLIERCIDWKGQEYQYHPSHTSNPNLQIYHGVSQVVQEFGGSLLTDASRRVRNELRKLWRRYRRTKTPNFVYVLSYEALMQQPIDRLVRDAQLARGKVNILSNAMGKIIRTSIVLTHMDNAVGYRELQDGFGEEGLRFAIPLEQSSNLTHLTEYMRRFEVYLPYLMQRLPPDAAVKSANFLKDAPEFLARVNVIIDTLTKYDPTNDEPALDHLYLTSNFDRGLQAANPFTVQLSAKDVEKRHPYRRHRQAAAAIAVVGIAYLMAGYYYERQTIDGASEILQEAMRADPDEFDYKIQKTFYSYLADRRSSLLSKVLPEFAPNDEIFVEREITEGFIDSIETKLLLPELRRLELSAASGDLEKYLFLGAMAASTANNDLGRLILKNLKPWQRITGLSELLIRDYVSHSANQRVITPDLSNLRSRKAVEQILGTAIVKDWSPLLGELHDWSNNKTLISGPELLRVQEMARRVSQEIAEIRNHSLALQIIETMWKSMNAMIGPQWHLELSHRNIQNSSDLLPILGIIETASLNLSNLDTMTLSDVVTELKARSEQKNTGRSFRIQTPAGTYVVDTGRIKALIMRSGIAATMDGYRTLSSASNDWKRILFGRTASYRSVNLNAQPNDNSIFAGRSEIPGFFSVAAFNDRVVPLSTELPKILDKLTVGKAVIERFQDFVLATLTAYAADYARVYQDYFQAHRTREFSPQVLPYAASQMESSTSPILTLVKQMRDGTSFPDPKDNDYLLPFENVKNRYAFARNVVGNDATKSPTWAAYANLVGDVAARITSRRGYIAKKTDAYPELRDELSPFGREALDMIVEAPTAITSQVDTWLRGAKIRPVWQAPFRGFFDRVITVGLSNVEGVVSRKWKGMKAEFLQPLLKTFPFDRNAKDVAPLDVTLAVLSPKGEFWKRFDLYLKPLYQRIDDRWKLRNVAYGQIDLPAEMTEIINRLYTLRNLLHDAKGKSKPLSLRVRALPLPKANTRLKPVVANLQVGETLILAFNQRPQWQTVKFKWDIPAKSRLSVGYAAFRSMQKVFTGLGVSASRWSLYRFLNEGRRTSVDDLVWSWTARSQDPSIPAATVKFELNRDPWAILDIVPKAPGEGE